MHCTTNARTVNITLAKQIQRKNCCIVRSEIYRRLQKISWGQNQFRIPGPYGPRHSGMMRDRLACHTSDLPALSDATDSWTSTGSYPPVCEFCLSDLKCDTKLGNPECPQHGGPAVIQFYLSRIPTCEIQCHKTPASATGNRFSHYEEVSAGVVSQ